LIKVLSSQPFKKHRGIYNSVFYCVLNDLIVAAKTILGNQYKFDGIYDNIEIQSNFDILNAAPDEDWGLYIDTVTYLRVLIKYAGYLNIAYLLHADFLAAINELNKNFKYRKVLKKLPDEYKERGYAFENFKLFCAAHIIRSLYKNEQRAIKFEGNINRILKEEKTDTSLLELLILENTNIIRQTLENFKNTEDLQNIDKDMRFNDYTNFVNANKSEFFNYSTLENTHELRKLLIKKENSRNEKSIRFDQEATEIIKKIASIVGYEVSKDNEDAGGGLLLYKYQNIKSEENNYIVIANVGSNSLENLYIRMPQNTLAANILKGKGYLSAKSAKYTWTNFTVYFDDKKKQWKGQDGGVYKKIIVDQDSARRILFIRISDFDKKNELKGDAVFVLYDNQAKDEYNSVHKIRFVHTLRKEINDYFEKRYRNDSFRNWIEEKRISEDILLTEHHHKHHMKNLYDCAIKNPNPQKLKFFYDTVYETKAIKDFLKGGDISTLDDIINIEVKSKIDDYCELLLEPQVRKVINNNNISENMRICFSEMLFRYIMCEYIENINEAMRLYPDPNPFGVAPTAVINALPQNDGIEFIFENNFLMGKDDIQKMPSINKFGFSNKNSSGGLPTNKKLLRKIGSEEISVRMEKTVTDGIGKFVVKFKIKNINENDNENN
jgi:hypothetical protein